MRFLIKSSIRVTDPDEDAFHRSIKMQVGASIDDDEHSHIIAARVDCGEKPRHSSETTPAGSETRAWNEGEVASRVRKRQEVGNQGLGFFATS